MAVYQEKYYYTFQGLDGTDWRVEIWEDTTDSVTAQEIRCGVDPFIIDCPQFELFEPIRGTGCEMNLLSQTDRQFIGLYTADMFKFKILLKKAGFIQWCGYLDTELYKEPFDQLDNYIVNLTGTDGLALLDRLAYVQSDSGATHFTGIQTQWEMLENCLTKVGLDWWGICVALSTTSSEFTIGSTETIFHKTYMSNDNWYNEDGKPETCRKVVESILAPYGAFLMISENKLIITDINTILSTTGTLNVKVFYPNNFDYAGVTTLKFNQGDVSTIGFYKNSQNLNIINGINKQVIKYSPYRYNKLIDYDATKDNFTSYGNITTYFGQTDYQWSQSYWNHSDYWTKDNLGAFCKLTVLDGENKGTTDQYLQMVDYGGGIGGVPSYIAPHPDRLSFTYTKQLPTIVPSSTHYFLKLEMEAYVRTFSDYQNPDDVPSQIKAVQFVCNLTLNDKRAFVVEEPYGTAVGWTSTGTTGYYTTLSFVTPQESGTNFDYEPIEDSWRELRAWRLKKNMTTGEWSIKDYDILFPLTDDLNYLNSGILKFEIYNWNAYDYDSNFANDLVNDVRIKNVKITIVDSNGEELQEKDIEYEGIFNEQFKNAGQQITLLAGTNVDGYPMERGGMMLYDGTGYTWITEWTRASTTDIIEKLLLRSIMSNYETPSIQITATINTYSSNNELCGYLTYSNYLPDKFLITSYTKNLADASVEITMEAISADGGTIQDK